MSADLHIHALDNGVTEEDLYWFGAAVGGRGTGDVPERGVDVLENQETGEKYEWPWVRGDIWEELYEKIGNTDSVWIGAVSWLKAELFGEEDGGREYVPEPVEVIQDLIGYKSEKLPVLTPELREQILEALRVPSTADPYYKTAKRERVEPFLDRNMGKRLFTISW